MKLRRRFRSGCDGADHRARLAVREVSGRLGVSRYSLKAQNKTYRNVRKNDSEIRRPKHDLERVAEERGTSEKTMNYVALGFP